MLCVCVCVDPCCWVSSTLPKLFPPCCAPQSMNPDPGLDLTAVISFVLCTPQPVDPDSDPDLDLTAGPPLRVVAVADGLFV